MSKASHAYRLGTEYRGGGPNPVYIIGHVPTIFTLLQYYTCTWLPFPFGNLTPQSGPLGTMIPFGILYYDVLKIINTRTIKIFDITHVPGVNLKEPCGPPAALRGLLHFQRLLGRVLTCFDRLGTIGMERDYWWSFVPFQAVFMSILNSRHPSNRPKQKISQLTLRRDRADRL